MFVIKNSENMFYNGCIFNGKELSAVVVSKESYSAVKFKSAIDAEAAKIKLEAALENGAKMQIHGEIGTITSKELHVEFKSEEKIGFIK